ncbi:MAG: hypothetical protein Q8N99_05030 [Nanoarchaeota archaeon]|nr:hypothetical protein [Nanoarchaeota archaeon]
MAILFLENLGQVGDYQPKLRLVTPGGVCRVGPDIAAVKLYTMFEYGTNPYWSKDISTVKNLVGSRLRSGKINRKNGLGFGILSEGVLNVTMLGGDFASLMTPEIFIFEAERLRSLKDFEQQNVRESGAYCVWEMKDIASFEANSYARNILYTGGSEKGKEKYLQDRLFGVTSDFSYCPEEQRLKVELKHLGFCSKVMERFRQLGLYTFEDLIRDLNDGERWSGSPATLNLVKKRLAELGL